MTQTQEPKETKKRALDAKPHSKNKRKYKTKSCDATSPLGVLDYEINHLLKQHELEPSQVSNDMNLLLNNKEVEEAYHRIVKDVEVVQLTSNGDGLGLVKHIEADKFQVVIIPFGLPGDIVTIRIFKTHPYYVESDLLAITKNSHLRDDSLINCKYFGKCSGCQYQNISYQDQLELKKSVIENAYKFFATEIADQIPKISDTEPSPLQYQYRTKLTPHFNVPHSVKHKGLDFLPPLGFGAKGRPEWRQTLGGNGSIVDIEECSIGTFIINQGMRNQRQQFQNEYQKYKKGATFLLRENSYKQTTVVGDAENESCDDSGHVTIFQDHDITKTCATKSRFIVTEYVGEYKFQFSAGEFFQNNNSILPAVTNYVRQNLHIGETPNYLIDAYCGSGLFSITCSTGVSKVIGVEVSADSVKFAKINAAANNIENAEFIVGKAEKIFDGIDLPPLQTSIILDPPRKGCDEIFMSQLAKFNPAKIVYISCNVHSQARDINWFLHHTENGKLFTIESIKGFDFFPQTHHVESVAVLTRI